MARGSRQGYELSALNNQMML